MLKGAAVYTWRHHGNNKFYLRWTYGLGFCQDIRPLILVNFFGPLSVFWRLVDQMSRFVWEKPELFNFCPAFLKLKAMSRNVITVGQIGKTAKKDFTGFSNKWRKQSSSPVIVTKVAPVPKYKDQPVSNVLKTEQVRNFYTKYYRKIFKEKKMQPQQRLQNVW